MRKTPPYRAGPCLVKMDSLPVCACVGQKGAGRVAGAKMSAQGDCEFLVKRARELVQGDLWAAKAWLITARSLYPADFNIQVAAGTRAAAAAASLQSLTQSQCFAPTKAASSH